MKDQKNIFKLLKIALLGLIFVSCKEQTAFSEFEKKAEAQLNSENSIAPTNRCEQYSKDQEQCIAVSDCQEVVKESASGDIFLGCIPLEDKKEEDKKEEDKKEEDKKEEDKREGDKREGDTKVCGKGKILICHVPPGNVESAKTLCISSQGFENGHKERHEGDHLGACDLEDM